PAAVQPGPPPARHRRSLAPPGDRRAGRAARAPVGRARPRAPARRRPLRARSGRRGGARGSGGRRRLEGRYAVSRSARKRGRLLPTALLLGLLAALLYYFRCGEGLGFGPGGGEGQEESQT